MGPMPTRYLAATVALGAAVLAGSSGCSKEYDFERNDYRRESLGDELHAIWLKDARRAPENAEAKTTLLEREKQPFVRSINTLAPADQLREVDLYFRNTVPSTRSGLMPSLTRKLRRSLQMATRDDRLLEAMVSRDVEPPADAYLSPRIRPNLPHHLLQYDDLRGATTTLGDAMLGADGLDAHGQPASGEPTAFLDAQRLAADALADTRAPDQSESVSTAAASLRDVLLVEDGRFQLEDRQTSLPAVRFDSRGYPRVRRTPEGDPIHPFVDDDDDGLADVDSQGRFLLDGRQSARRVEPFTDEGTGNLFPRDDSGRAHKSGDPVFEYIDLAHTGADFLIRQTARLHENDVLWNLLDGLPELLGERTSRSDEFGDYRGYDGRQPLIDFLDAGAHMFALDELPGIARSLAEFIDRSRPELAELIHALRYAKGVIDRHPNARLADYSTIGYDLLPLLEEISADPDLWSDVMAALREPIFQRFGEPLATMVQYADKRTVPDPEGAYEQCFQQCRSIYEARATDRHPNGIGTVGRYECIEDCPTDELFGDQTEFSAAESPDNRSINAQVFHLLRDTAGVTYEMRVTKAGFAGIDIESLPAIMVLPGAAEAFIATIAGNLRMEEYITDEYRSGSTLGNLLKFFGIDPGDVADLLSTMSGLFGTHLDPSPTPDQITRMFNQKDLKFQNNGLTIDVNEPVCKDGYVMAEHHADKLFASEASGLIDTVQPLAKAFSDHDREDLLAEVFVVFHNHYSSHETLYKRKDGSPSPMKGANFTSFELPLLTIARDGRVFEALHKFAIAADRAKPVDGVAFEERLRQLIHHAAERDPDYDPRGVQTPLQLPDDTTVENPSRLHALLYNAGRLVDRVEDDSEATDKLTDAIDDIGDVLLATERDESGTYRLKRPGTFALLSLALRELADQADRWKANGAIVTHLLESWQDDWTAFFESRTLPTMVDLLRRVADDSERKETAHRLVTHMVDSDRAHRQWTATLYQMLLEGVDAEDTAPIAQFLGSILDPDRTWNVSTRRDLPLLSHLLTFLQRMLERDESGTGIAMVRRGTRTDQNGKTAFGQLGGIILDYYRSDPASEATYTAADYRHSLSRLAAWIGDDVHGLEQLYDIIRQHISD